jgi:hypothetical protein
MSDDKHMSQVDDEGRPGLPPSRTNRVVVDVEAFADDEVGDTAERIYDPLTGRPDAGQLVDTSASR